jgi:LAO/AO transport system kinase
VDPTSPFTGGAVLGDRLRMQRHSADEGVFIRSMATRGHLGGLSRATSDAALVLDAAGKDVIIIETVGVGQDEVDIIRTADVSVVTLVPGTGDDVQTRPIAKAPTACWRRWKPTWRFTPMPPTNGGRRS